MATLTPAHVDVFSKPLKPPGPPSKPLPPTPRFGGRRRLLMVASIVAILAVAAVFVVSALRPPPLMELPVSGRLEGYQSDLGAKVGGRVVWVAVREGAVVRAGQVLVRLDDAQARAQSAK